MTSVFWERTLPEDACDLIPTITPPAVEPDASESDKSVEV